MKYIKKIYGTYCYKANHATLTKILQDNNVELKLPGDRYHGFSCYPDRNYVYILGKVSEKRLDEIENMYINCLIKKGVNRLQPIPNTEEQFFIMIKKLYELHGHTEPILLPQNIVWIGSTNCYGGNWDSERKDYYMDINKIEIQRHINIQLPRNISKCWCIGRQGCVVSNVECKLREIVGFQVFLHYHDFPDDHE